MRTGTAGPKFGWVVPANEINAALGTYINDIVSQLSASPVDMQVTLPALRTAEQEKARQLGSEVGPSEPRGSKMVQLEEIETLASSIGSTSDKKEQPLELERQLVAKEASLPQELTFDDVNAVNPDQKVSKMKEFMSNVCTALRTI
ncbi:hypothetical protein Tco_1188429, partial [Tanacetum coccineum]